MLRSNSPGRSTFAWFPVTKSTAATSRGVESRGHKVYTPSRATVREIIGPAGSDIQIFPPTVASFQILNDASSDRQHSRKSGAAVHAAGALNRSSSTILQVAATSSPSADACRDGQ